MGAFEILSIGMAVAGIGVMVVALFQLMRRRVNVAAADQVVLKLVRAGNVDRAAKLGEAAPNTHLVAYVAAIRAGQTTDARDPVTIAALTHPAFERSAAALSTYWVQTSVRGLMGAMVAGGGFALGYSLQFSPTILRVLGGLGVLGAVWFAAHFGELGKALATGRTEVLPEIDRAFAGVGVESTT